MAKQCPCCDGSGTMSSDHHMMKKDVGKSEISSPMASKVAMKFIPKGGKKT